MKIIHKKYIIGLSVHIVLIMVLYALFFQVGIFSAFPTSTSVMHWDAIWYKSIKKFGYIYHPNRICNMAFFPLFPLLWKASCLSRLGISIFNLLLFIFSFGLLIRRKILSVPELLLLLSIPSYLFFSLPYSESLFFFFGTLLIVSLQAYWKKEGKINKLLLLTGMAGCCLTRSVSVIFIPAILITMIISASSNSKNRKTLITDTIVYLSTCVISILLVALMQWWQTGKLFYFFSIQQYWNRHFIFPGIPFTTMAPDRNLGLDSAALLLGGIAIFFCIRWALRYIINRRTRIDAPPEVLFSALFLSAITILDVFFTYNQNGHANIWSLNRHVLCTPFAVEWIIWIWKEYVPWKYDIFIIYGIIVLILYISGVYQYLATLVYFIAFIFFFLIRKFQPDKLIITRLAYGMYVFSLVWEIELFSGFLNGIWVA